MEKTRYLRNTNAIQNQMQFQWQNHQTSRSILNPFPASYRLETYTNRFVSVSRLQICNLNYKHLHGRHRRVVLTRRRFTRNKDFVIIVKSNISSENSTSFVLQASDLKPTAFNSPKSTL